MKKNKGYDMGKFEKEFRELYLACEDVLKKVSGITRYQISTSDRNLQKKIDRFFAKTGGTIMRGKSELLFHKEEDGFTVATSAHVLIRGNTERIIIGIAA